MQQQQSSTTSSLTQFINDLPDVELCGNSVGDYLQQQLKKIESTPVKVGICGRAGVGKSTLINTLRGLPPPLRGTPEPVDPAAAAPTDIEECTRRLQYYTDPRFPSIQFWDLPGCGTPTNPLATYAETNQLDTFDCFLIVGSSRFYEEDLNLADLIRDYEKPHSFVYTKVDQDIASDRRVWGQNGRTPPPDEDVITRLRRGKILTHLGQERSNRVFFISGLLENSELYEFPRLRKEIIESVPDKAKRSMLRLAFSSWSQDAIDEKYRVLKAHLVLYAGAAAAGGAVPVPGLSIAVNIGTLAAMARHSAKAFGLTEKQLQEHSSLLDDADVQDQARQVISSTLSLLANETIQELLQDCAAEFVVAEVAQFIPFVGNLLASSTSFGITYLAGKRLLKRIRAKAEQLAGLLANRIGAGPAPAQQSSALVK